MIYGNIYLINAHGANIDVAPKTAIKAMDGRILQFFSSNIRKNISTIIQK